MRLLDTCSLHTSHSAAEVFARWADPEGWPVWDTEVREVRFAGPAELGAVGWMRPASGPASRFSVTAFEPDRVFTNATALPGATLIFEHRVTPTAEGAAVEVEVGVAGLLAPVWQRLLGRALGHGARSSVTGLLQHLDAA